MQIAHLHSNSEIYGPGKRFVIWTQGCFLHCPGCWNTEFWNFKGGISKDISELISEIKASISEIEGVTVLGGEPFDQASELGLLLPEIQQLGLSVMVYSGYTMDELIDAGHQEILSKIDILVEGRYEHQLRNTNLRWRGSENQNLLFLSSRYQNCEFEEYSEIEIVLDENGAQQVYGYPDDWVLEL